MSSTPQKEAKEPTNFPITYNRLSGRQSSGTDVRMQSISNKMRYRRLGTTSTADNKRPGAQRVDGPGVFDVTERHEASTSTTIELQRQSYRALPAHATRMHRAEDDEIPSSRHKAAILALTAMGESSERVVGHGVVQSISMNHLVVGASTEGMPRPTNSNAYRNNRLSSMDPRTATSLRGHLPEDDNDVSLQEESSLPESHSSTSRGDEEEIIEAHVHLPVAAKVVHQEESFFSCKRPGLVGGMVAILLSIIIVVVVASSVATRKNQSSDSDGGVIPTISPTPKVQPTLVPTVTPSQASTPSTCSTTRCGTSWTDTNDKCGILCTIDDSPCPTGEKCYGGLQKDCCDRVALTPAAGCSANRCGVDWNDANGRCGNTCTDNISCPDGENCYGSLKTDLACCLDDEVSQNCPSVRCGTDWTEANSRCGMDCSEGSTCPDGEFCFDQLDTSQCSDKCTAGRQLLRSAG